MSTAIVITTIYEPTEAVKKFAQLDGFNLIIVGDNKTPANWACANSIFLPVNDERTSGYELARKLPYNHYSRKMLGYLYAIEHDATAIIDTDDDNIPKTDWAFPPFEGEFESAEADKGFINIYNFFTDMFIWPRGYPLKFITSKEKYLLNKKHRASIGIWQGLADGDPDVDAIYRFTNNTPCFFNDREPLYLPKGTITPFNTQNTIIRNELFALLYLPTYVTFRFTDILRGLVAQPIMWSYGYHLGFTDATVVQKRNGHDYYQDFLSELPMFHHCERVIPIVQEVISKDNSLAENMILAYTALFKNDIVPENEIVTLKAWLADLDKLK
jgi:hypothetical protein